jgi:hypothetical protein
MSSAAAQKSKIDQLMSIISSVRNKHASKAQPTGATRSDALDQLPRMAKALSKDASSVPSL